MARFMQFHHPELSIWQAAVGEVEARRPAGAQAQDVGTEPAMAGRPDDFGAMSAEALSYCLQVANGATLTDAAAVHPATESLAQTIGLCSLTALKLAKAVIADNAADKQRYGDELKQFGGCDPRYAEASALYTAYFLAQQKQIPYIVYKNLGDFVIDDKLPSVAKVAIVGDWGTGQNAAQLVLRQIANKSPDVVIHLGDIYFACTQFEVNNYFLKLWQRILNLAQKPIPTFTLAGNHDMYSGGVAYYNLLKTLGQPASYFCLRNANWQFVAMDTGYNDHNPSSAGEGATYLQDSEVEWLADKVNNAGGRRTLLLSHHQLFTAFDSINGNELNLRLYPQVAPLLPKVTLWMWGHEHNFVLYGAYKNLARSCCLGHGAFPVGQSEVPSQPKYADVPLRKDADGNNIVLGTTAGLYNHGYAIIELSGAQGKVSYYQDSDEDNPMFQESLT